MSVNDEFVQDRTAMHNCSKEEAEYLWLITEVIDQELYPFQEAALLELRRAHKDGRRPLMSSSRFRRKR